MATVFFGGKGDYLSLLRAESHASIIGWAGIIPFIGALVGLWHLPVSVVILQNVYGMPREKAIATVAVIAGFFLLLGLVAVLFFGALLGGFLAGMGAGGRGALAGPLRPSSRGQGWARLAGGRQGLEQGAASVAPASSPAARATARARSN